MRFPENPGYRRRPAAWAVAVECPKFRSTAYPMHPFYVADASTVYHLMMVVQHMRRQAINIVADREPVKFRRGLAICGNVMELSKSLACQQLVMLLMYKYAAGRGDFRYPVGGEEEFDYEASHGILWQNPRRLAILGWLDAELTRMYNRTHADGITVHTIKNYWYGQG